VVAQEARRYDRPAGFLDQGPLDRERHSLQPHPLIRVQTQIMAFRAFHISAEYQARNGPGLAAAQAGTGTTSGLSAPAIRAGSGRSRICACASAAPPGPHPACGSAA